MKVLKVELRNFKKHEDLVLDVEGRNIFLLGPNEVGKSSILDSIFFALNSAKETPESKIPEPLTTGKNAGHVIVVVGSDNKEYTITRKFTKDNDDRKLTIVTKDGMSTTKLDMLEGLVGYRKVNPFEFVAWGTTADGRRKQLQLIESLLPKDILEGLNRIKQFISLKEEALKTENQEQTTLKNSLNTLGVTEVDLLMYSEEINVQAESDKLTELHIHNGKVREMNTKKESIQTSIIAKNKEISRLQEQIYLLKAGVQEETEDLTAAIRWIDANPMKDTDAIVQKITEANQHNARYALVKKHGEVCASLKTAEEKYNGTKTEIERLQYERKETIAAAKLPIPGLTFDAEQVYLHGLPLHDKQLATSQIMRLAFAIALATVKDDKLKLLCIPRGESLDKNAIADLKQFLKENPTWQAFVEEVDRNEENLKIEYFETI